MLRRFILLLLAALIFSLPALAEDPIFRLRVGQFTPEGNSVYWNDKIEFFDGSAKDLEDVSYGVDWNYPISRGMGILLSGSYFKGETEQSTWEDASFSGTHETKMRLVSLSVLFTYMAPQEWRFRPWIGIGGGAYQWRLREAGYVWDEEGDLIEAELSDDDLTFGVSVAIGLDFWVKKNWGFSADFRQYWVDDVGSGAFSERGKIDLSGQEIAAGFIWKF